MDYILIGPYQFVRDAAKDDMRLDYCSTYREVELDESILSFDTMNAEVCTATVGAQLSALPDNTPVIIYRDDKVFTRFVKRSISRIGPSTYQIVGRSPMGALTNMEHRGGIYTGETVAEVVTDICGNIPVLVKSIFAEIKLYGWLPYADGKSRSARDNLAQVLFAIGAYLGTDLNGVLRVDPLWNGTASIIDNGRPYTGGTVNYDPPISAVTVTEHQYVAGAEEKELFSGTAQKDDIITFSEPMHSLTADGFSILESGANYAKISAGTGTLKGKAYIHNTRLVTRTVTKDAPENVESFSDATLVSLVNSSAVAKRLADYFKCRETIINDIVSGQEKPGHVVSVYHPYDKKMVLACIQSLDTTMSATLKSNMSALVGFLPPQPETTEYYDERVLLTGSGTWTVPEGVTTYTKVLIGGGQGGKCGANGSSAEARASWTETDDGTTDSRRRYVYVPRGEGVPGGDAGDPGAGGKVLVETVINAVPGAKVPYACGVGGVGALSDSTEDGSHGTATTMGGSSSDSGSVSLNGYTDPVTGDTYAMPGDAGIAGSRGHGYKIENNQYVEIPSPAITVDGVTYKAGADSTESGEDGRGNWTSGDYGYVGYEWHGGYGGGAAVGSNGGAATARGSGHVSSSSASVISASGGAGANASAPPKEARCGYGGRGGNGGGGAGGYGYADSHQTTSKSGSFQTARLYAQDGTAAPGGRGSDGGEAGDGCIIIYYRKFGQVRSGPLVQRGGGLFFDRLNKLFIV